MRTLITLACLGLASCDADGLCDSVAMGSRVPSTAVLVDQSAYCAKPLGRNRVRFDGPQTCHPAPDGGCLPAQLYSYGEVIDEGPGGASQCCLLVNDGIVVERYVHYD